MASQQRGKITAWKEEKGFGFITPEGGGADVFVHVSSLPPGLKRPPLNAAVSYSLGYDSQRRPQAVTIRFDRDPVTMPLLPALVAGAFFLALGAAASIKLIAPSVFILYALASALTFVTYGRDKAIAQRNERRDEEEWHESRVSESSLHRMELFGGWPGALVAQWFFRHKNRKSAYQLAYWLNVALNLLILGGYIAYNLFIGRLAGLLF